MEQRGAWATESTDYSADDTASQFKIYYRADALKTDVNMFQNIKYVFSLGKVQESLSLFQRTEMIPKRKVAAKRSQHTNPRYCNIVGRNMLHAFGHRVATCWVLWAQIGPFSNLSQQHPTTWWPKACNM